MYSTIHIIEYVYIALYCLESQENKFPCLLLLQEFEGRVASCSSNLIPLFLGRVARL